MDAFQLFLCIFLVLFGVSAFTDERVIIVLAGIAAIIAGVIGLARLL